jgi:hypothetical protein
MKLNSQILQEDEEKINFQDKLSLLFLVIGAIFIGLIVISLAMNVLNLQQMDFATPFG